ncbi:MAG: hydrogenase formation protein HypD [Magnetococcus sp. YQC-5]
MKYIDGFRALNAANGFRQRLAHWGTLLARQGRRVRIMEVCGSHTMAIARFGIRDFLPDNVTLISGPGCPVCVTATGYIDAAVALANKGVVIASFGDMVRVPGSHTNLEKARAQGAEVVVCYSPLEALTLAMQNHDREVVFLAVGFETTAAPILAMLNTALNRSVENFSLLTAFKQIPPALEALASDPEIRVEALLCPAHVSAIIGSDAYRPFALQWGIPCVVAGFEPLDILYGLDGLLEQLVMGGARVDNQYNRVVNPAGNPVAQKLMEQYLLPVDAWWRGLGVIPGSGLELRGEYREWDGSVRHEISIQTGTNHPYCQCGDVLKGKTLPMECPLLGSACTPDHPIGPCMVSSEGSCAASFKYERAMSTGGEVK